MREFIFAHLDHALCVMLLMSRVGDVVSTYLISPTLQLEANPIARRLGWRFIVLTLGACVIPYFSIDIGLAVLVPFLLVSASNTARIWTVRTMGEREYKRLLLTLAARSKLSHALLGVIGSAVFIVVTGLVILFFYPDSVEDPGFWIGIGVVMYGT